MSTTFDEKEWFSRLKLAKTGEELTAMFNELPEQPIDMDEVVRNVNLGPEYAYLLTEENYYLVSVLIDFFGPRGMAQEEGEKVAAWEAVRKLLMRQFENRFSLDEPNKRLR